MLSRTVEAEKKCYGGVLACAMYTPSFTVTVCTCLCTFSPAENRRLEKACTIVVPAQACRTSFRVYFEVLNFTLPGCNKSGGDLAAGRSSEIGMDPEPSPAKSVLDSVAMVSVDHVDIMRALSGAHMREIGIAIKAARPVWQEAHVQVQLNCVCVSGPGYWLFRVLRCMFWWLSCSLSLLYFVGRFESVAIFCCRLRCHCCWCWCYCCLLLLLSYRRRFVGQFDDVDDSQVTLGTTLFFAHTFYFFVALVSKTILLSLYQCI